MGTSGRSLRPWAACVLAAVLCACAPATKSGRGEGYVWSVDVASDSAELSLGLPETDAVAITFGCAPAAGRVTVARPVAKTWKAGGLSAQSGEARSRWTARFEPDGDIAPGWAVGELSLRDTVLQAFAETGRLTIDDHVLDARDNVERRAVAAFVRACA